MEGVLWKWTNYWNGWQTRWFILDNGVLAYYKSQEEVNQGCKGSMKVSACEINVNAIDNTRMDLVIPGEQHMYLKAASSQERQKWLVALGSAKACVRTYTDMTDPAMDALKSKKSELRLYCDLLMQQVHMVKTEANSENGPQVERLNEATSLLSATCDTFIKSLEDCMRLSNSKLELPVVNESSTPVTPTNPLPPSKLKGVKINGKENYLKSSSDENS